MTINSSFKNQCDASRVGAITDFRAIDVNPNVSKPIHSSKLDQKWLLEMNIKVTIVDN